jgi:hypothetical protein
MDHKEERLSKETSNLASFSSRSLELLQPRRIECFGLFGKFGAVVKS